MGELIILAVSMYGLAIVISMIVAVVIWGIGLTVAAAHRKAAPAPAVAAPAAPAPEDHAGDIAAIAAAVYAVLGAHRIVHIEEAGHGTIWTAEGRLMHQTSHKVRASSH